jgi:cytochrome c
MSSQSNNGRSAATSAVMAAALVVAGFAASPAHAAGDASHGQKVLQQCQVCHTITPGKNAIGPSLAGVVGRKAGTAAGYKYSDGMTKAGEGGLVWSDKILERYLEDPKSVVPGNKMTFAGLKKQEDRDDVISFLTSKSQ